MRLLFITLLSLLANIGFAQSNEVLAEMERIYKETYDAEAGIQSCNVVLAEATPHSKEYFKANFYLGQWFVIAREKEKMKALLKELKQTLTQKNYEESSEYWLQWHYLKSIYNSELTYNIEKAGVHSVSGLHKSRENPTLLQLFSLQTAFIFANAGQYDLGEKTLKAYQLAGRFAIKSEFDRCKYHLNMGKAYRSLEMYAKAEKELLKAVETIEPLAKEAPKLLVYARYELALNYGTAGDDNNKKAVQVLEQLLEEGNRDYQILALLSEVMFFVTPEKSEYILALMQEALSEMIPGFTPDSYTDNPLKTAQVNDLLIAGRVLYYKSFVLRYLALEHLEKGATEKAIPLLNKAIETGEIGVAFGIKVIDELIGYGVTMLTVTEMTHIFMGVLIHASKTLYDVTGQKEDLNRLFTYMEKRRCFLIHQALSENPLPPPYAEKQANYEKQIETLELEFLQLQEKAPPSLFDKIIAVNEDYEVFVEELFQTTDKVRINQNDIDYLSVEDIQASLDEETAFIQYSVVRRHLYAILITKESTQVELLRHGIEFEEKVRAYTKRVKSRLLIQDKNRDDFIDRSKELYDLMILPFEEKIEGKKRLVISPERELLFLPYETLLKSAEKKSFSELDFLIKKMEINYRYSAALHQKIQSRPAITDFSTLAFAPVFDKSNATGTNDRFVDLFEGGEYGIVENDQFVPLLNSKQEVETINDLLKDKGNATLLMKKKATKQNLTAEIAKQPHQFIHIATHSTVNILDPRLSAIACYQSGGEENLYFSNEIIHAPIEADLVILSSCESGIGRIISGEGLIGLNRSFLSAGVRNVLFSLWKVSDKESSELMIDFYKFYLENPSYTTALHQAKLKMLSDPQKAMPRYWASFVLIGE